VHLWLAEDRVVGHFHGATSSTKLVHLDVEIFICFLGLINDLCGVQCFINKLIHLDKHV
jgi:hypothetical protein